MAKRMMSTELFHEDWFVELSPDEKLFFVYAILNCDHGGFLRVNLRVFNALNGTNVVPESVFSVINEEKQRLREITPRVWFIEDFIHFQYGRNLNPENRVHKSVLDLLEKNGVSLGSIKGLTNPSQGVKEKEKDRVKDTSGESRREGAEITLNEVLSTFKSILTSMSLPPDAFGDVTELAQNYFNHYGSQRWCKGTGVPISNHRLLISKWLMTEKNRNSSNRKPRTAKTRSWE